MNIRYNVEKLKEIIDELGEVTGLALAILDSEFNFLYMRGRADDDFCDCLQGVRECRLNCAASDEKMLLECKSTGKPHTHICHAGLRDTVVPILKNGSPVGYVIIGRLRPDCELSVDKPPFSESPKLWRERYSRLSYLSEKQLGSLINLLSHLLFENAIEIDYGEFVEKAVAYIDAHISERLTVEGLSAALFVSKNRLYEGFHSYFSTTVGEYVTSKRISLAKRLLATTEKSAAEISSAVGMENYSYFSKLFKRRVGCSPSEYRKRG